MDEIASIGPLASMRWNMIELGLDQNEMDEFVQT